MALVAVLLMGFCPDAAVKGQGPSPSQKDPTASFMVSKNGGAFTHRVTAKVGDTITYRWSSTNGVSYSSNDVISPNGKDGCGNSSGPMAFDTASNTTRAYPLLACQSGFTYTMTYTVTAANGATASETITIAVE